MPDPRQPDVAAGTRPATKAPQQNRDIIALGHLGTVDVPDNTSRPAYGDGPHRRLTIGMTRPRDSDLKG